MPLAANLFFITPALENPDVALQGLNTWQSKAHGMIGSATLARFAARAWGLYAVLVLTAAWAGDVMQHHFYVSVLSAVLIHYYFEHVLFLRIDCIITPSRMR